VRGGTQLSEEPAINGGSSGPGGGKVRPTQANSLAAFKVPLAALVGVLVALARPGADALSLSAVALLPLAALVLAGPARAATVATGLGYVAALVWAYTSYISPVFAYDGLIDARPSSSATLLVAVLAVLPAMWLPLSAVRPSTVVLWSLYVLGYVPAMVVPLFVQGDLEAILPFHVALVGSMATTALILRMPPPPIPLPHLSVRAWTRLVLCLGVLCCLYILATFGFRSSLPSLGDVYDTRAAFTTAVGAAAGAGYVTFWAANAINPLLMTLGLARSRADLLMLGLLGQLVIYSVTGLKSVLFSILLVPLVYYAVSNASRLFGLLATAMGPVILVGASLLPLGSLWPLALANRTLVTPGQIGGYYFEFFSVHPQYHLSHSFLGWVFPRVYAQEPPLVIGAAYFPETTPNANANMWADAFANFGFGGIVVFTVVLGLVLWITDGLGRGRDARVAAPMLAIAGLSLANGALFTTVLTGGLAVGCALIALMPPVVRQTESG